MNGENDVRAMMTTINTVGTEAFASLESKGMCSLSVEEERDYYRQRFLSMKLVLKEIQQQLAVYKTRCTGVDTVTLMLKESKQEVMKLTKQRKALEIAVANLQNRLSTNGLSSSVNIEETELFVPGASKQTLDNLARENARLRSLLKSTEAQSGKKPSEDLQFLKTSLENLEGENNQLKTQLLEVEGLKLNIVKQYEEVIKKMKEGHEVESREQEESNVEREKSSARHNEEEKEVERKSKGCQTVEIESSKIEVLKRTLRQFSEQCLQFHSDLDSVHLKSSYAEQNDEANEKKLMQKDETILDLERKLQQVIQMNQRWQLYNEKQEQQIHALVVRIKELEGLTQESEMFRGLVKSKDLEIQNLKQDVDNLKREANQRQSQPPFDWSIVEILKQQIQVCTEDFNTERKDREHAVSRAKQLHEEVKRLSHEKVEMEKEILHFKKSKSTSELEKGSAWDQIHQASGTRFKARGPQFLPPKIPFSTYSPKSSIGESVSPMSRSLSPVTSAVASPTSNESYEVNTCSPYVSGTERQGSVFPYIPIVAQGNISDFRSLPRPNRRSVPENPPSPRAIMTSSNISMPPMNMKANNLRDDSQQNLSCPKCNKTFLDSELLRHIDLCSD